MEIKTVWGVNWKTASSQDLLILLLIVLVILLILMLIHLYIKSSNNVSHEYQYILFKAKNRGLTNFQYKILRGMAEMLKLKHPSLITKDPGLYEKSIGSFIQYVVSQDEGEHSLIKIFKDIVITYEKMYKDVSHKPPIGSLDELQSGHLIYFYLDEKNIFLGKTMVIDEGHIKLQLFRKSGTIPKISVGTQLFCFFWRPGDAEYYFESRLISVENNLYTLELPDSFNRGQEVRLPYINVLIPCMLSYKVGGELTTQELTIYKIGEFEFIIRSSRELDYSREYTVEFTITEFTVTSPVILIADKTISDKGIYYYTFKIRELSPAARHVIRSYIYEHI